MDTYDAFHGTQFSVARELKVNGKKAIKKVDYSWNKILNGEITKKPGSLGYGFYTFIDDKELAYNFACHFGNKPIVFKIEIKKSANILTFADGTEDMSMFNKWLNENDHIIEILKRKYTNDYKQKSLDGALIEAFCWSLKKAGVSNIEAVKEYTHTEIGPKIPKTALPNGIELTVRDPEIIIGDKFEEVKI